MESKRLFHINSPHRNTSLGITNTSCNSDIRASANSTLDDSLYTTLEVRKSTHSSAFHPTGIHRSIDLTDPV